MKLFRTSRDITWTFIGGVLGVLIVVLLFMATGCAIPSYVTKHNVNIYDNTTKHTPSVEEVESVIDFALMYFGGEEAAKKIEHVDVYLYDHWLHIPQPDDTVILADGYTDIWEEVILASVLQTCFADSGLLHELAHIVHDKGAIAPDWWHDDKEFWKFVKLIEEVAIKELCPEGYRHQYISPNYVVH